MSNTKTATLGPETVTEFRLIIAYWSTKVTPFVIISKTIMLLAFHLISILQRGPTMNSVEGQMGRLNYVDKLIIAGDLSFMRQNCLENDGSPSHRRLCMIRLTTAMTALFLSYFYYLPWRQCIANNSKLHRCSSSWRDDQTDHIGYSPWSGRMATITKFSPTQLCLMIRGRSVCRLLALVVTHGYLHKVALR